MEAGMKRAARSVRARSAAFCCGMVLRSWSGVNETEQGRSNDRERRARGVEVLIPTYRIRTLAKVSQEYGGVEGESNLNNGAAVRISLCPESVCRSRGG